MFIEGVSFVFEAIDLLALPSYVHPLQLTSWHFRLVYTRYSPTGEALLLILCFTHYLKVYWS